MDSGRNAMRKASRNQGPSWNQSTPANPVKLGQGLTRLNKPKQAFEKNKIMLGRPKAANIAGHAEICSVFGLGGLLMMIEDG